MSARPPITELMTWHRDPPRPPVPLPTTLPAPYRLEVVHRFEEPLFTELLDAVFHGPTGQLRWAQLGFEEDPATRPFRREPVQALPRLRIAARHGDELIGWTYGFASFTDSWMMATSAVLPAHRRRGIYTALCETCTALVAEAGYRVVESHHVATNNPILIAKLRLGFHVTGLQLSPTMGTLLTLEKPLDDLRRTALLARSGLIPMPAAMADALRAAPAPLGPEDPGGD